MKKIAQSTANPIVVYYLSLAVAGHNFKDPIKWADGTFNPFYVDNSRAISNSLVRHMIRKRLPLLIEDPSGIDYIYPIPKAGIAPATLLALEIGKPLLIKNDSKYYSLDIKAVKELVNTKLSEPIKNSNAIAGTIPFGIIFGIVIAEKLRKPFLFVGEKPKNHGLMKQIEGIVRSRDVHISLIDPVCVGTDMYTADAIEALEKSDKNIGVIFNHPISSLLMEVNISGKRIATVDDLVSTGESISKISELIEKGGRVSPFSIFDYELPKSSEEFRRYGLVNKSMIGFLDFMKEYGKIISPADEKKIWNWYYDRPNWGDKNRFPSGK